ncbi:hypothetical protein [Alicyclobacillus shizuokensis]|uniref:hypothetical protein n=1 Tax=Alicyclobacillus shizuokensis TaxID=392014 RepID=UPI00082E62DB|nr:hypothetical protein [Alicyclobacillus shizuokensis]
MKGKRLRGDLEDTVVYTLFSIPLTLFAIWFAVDTYQMVHVHNLVYDAAKAAAVSAATQAQYSTVSEQNGIGFTSDVNVSQATTIANQVFQDQEQKAGLDQVIQVQSAEVSFPSPAHAQYTVTVSYTPQGIYAATDLIVGLLGHTAFPDPPPITWTVSPVAGLQGQTVS